MCDPKTNSQFLRYITITSFIHDAYISLLKEVLHDLMRTSKYDVRFCGCQCNWPHSFYSFETSDGIAQQESGQLTNPGSENESMAVRGSFSYTGPDGVVYTVTYIADENGFQPQGAHIPK